MLARKTIFSFRTRRNRRTPCRLLYASNESESTLCVRWVRCFFFVWFFIEIYYCKPRWRRLFIYSADVMKFFPRVIAFRTTTLYRRRIITFWLRPKSLLRKNNNRYYSSKSILLAIGHCLMRLIRSRWVYLPLIPLFHVVYWF